MSDTQKASLIGVPIDLGAKNLGVDVGPDAIRYQGLIDKLAGAGLTVTDLGDITVKNRKELQPGDSNMRYIDEIVRVCEELATKTEQAVNAGDKVIALGGDHSLNLGVMAGASAAVKGDLGLIYLDAHGDMNTPETTLTGNIHGMHLAAVIGFGPDKLTKVYGGQSPKIAKENLLHIAGCDFDQAELDLVEQENLQAFSMFDLLSNGLAPLFKAIDELASRVSNVWISLDLDSIDAVYAPGAGMPNKRGLTYREVVTIAEYVGKRCNTIGIDVVEYNPLQDVEHKTAELSIELIAKFLGKDYSWYTNYLNRNDVNKS
jgi:arginase